MTLHPDVWTDLVILYHAGEASLATRTLLEAEAVQNPAMRAALTAPPRTPAPMPVLPPDAGQAVLHDIRVLFRWRTIFACATVALLVLAVTVPHFRVHYPWLPFATLLLAWAVAFLTLRTHIRARGRL